MDLREGARYFLFTTRTPERRMTGAGPRTASTELFDEAQPAAEYRPCKGCLGSAVALGQEGALAALANGAVFRSRGLSIWGPQQWLPGSANLAGFELRWMS